MSKIIQLISIVFLIGTVPIVKAEEKSIPVRKSHSAVYDSNNKQMIVFGGAGKTGLLSDTWIFNIEKSTWEKIKAKVSPPAMWGHSAVYDDSNKQMLIFGGYAEKGGYLSDVWVFNIESKEWQRIKTKETPPARYGHSAIYDPVSKQMIIFGGKDIKPLGDTWTFDIEKKNWKEITTTKENPPASFGHSAIYDKTNKEMVIFIGTATWIYDIDKDEWTEKSGIFEISAFSFTAVYDSFNKKMLVFGCGIEGKLLPDTWVADIEGEEWNKVELEKMPPFRTRHTAVYDSENKQMIIFGGTDKQKVLSDIWIFDVDKKIWNEVK